MSSQEQDEATRLRNDLDALQHRFDALVTSTTDRIQKLEDENEVLAEANRLLLENAETFRRLNGPASENASLSSTSTTATSLLQIPDELLLPGAGLAVQEVQSVPETHAFGNLLSVAAHLVRRGIVLTGGADKVICAHDWTQQRKLCEFAASAPVLDLAFNPVRAHADVFVATFMDGRHALLRLVHHHTSDGDIDTSSSGWTIEELCSFHEHTRPGAMKVAWSATGELFATGASDKALHVFQCTFDTQHSDGSAATTACTKIKSFYFNGPVEAMTFVVAQPQQQQPNELLTIAVRDDCYVHYVDCVTFEKERINMNQDGIEHVSYTIMDLRVSPSGKYLLAATDASRHLIFAVKSNVVLRNLYGHKAGAYSQPRARWHPTEKYVLSNTEDSGAVFVWCIASERVVETIAAHDALVRDVDIAQIPALNADGENDNAVPATWTTPLLFTVSYDKLLKVSSMASLMAA